MKRMFILLAGAAVLTTGALAARAQDSMESQLSARLGKASELSSREVKANEMVKGNVAYSGIVVQALKTDNLLQLFNPFAPAKYGSAADNTLDDAASGKPRAWKLFSIRF